MELRYAAMKKIPYHKITTLFLDAGNTIVSMDFQWIATELRKRRVHTTVKALRRAEAASRPVVSKALSQLKSTEYAHFFLFYLRTVLERLPKTDMKSVRNLDVLIADLAPALKNPERRLWAMVMPGIRRALERLHSMGLQLVVVSNADGTVDAMFQELGLRHLFDHIVDSGAVGFEKPDPRIFRHALCKSGAAPGKTLHVGDIYDVDVAGARAAGIHALLLDPFDDWTGIDCERLPDLTSLAAQLAARRS
jgi:HAD superfamily hydrolase (TIGR01509 family)